MIEYEIAVVLTRVHVLLKVHGAAQTLGFRERVCRCLSGSQRIAQKPQELLVLFYVVGDLFVRGFALQILFRYFLFVSMSKKYILLSYSNTNKR